MSIEVVGVEEESRNEIKWYTASDVLRLKVKDGIWLWDTYIPRGEITGITGPSDTGKSTLLRQLALTIASGTKEFLGKPLHIVTGHVIYVSTEDGAIGLQQSLQKQVAGMGIDTECLGRIHFLFDEQDIFNELERKLKRQQVDLLAIDAMSDTFEGNANDFVAVRAYMRKLKSLARQYKCSVILLHHNTKNSEKGMPDKNKLNGSQALEAKMRSLFELRLGDNFNQRLLTILKGNYISQEQKKQSAVIGFDGDHLLFSSTGELKNSSLIRKLDGKVFDERLWVERMWIMREEKGVSFADARDLLVSAHPDEVVPGTTWFKTHC